MIYTLIGLLGIGIIVLIHEFGHYFVARFCGVGVETFSVGLGPRILSTTIAGTEFRLSAIPLGGYCRMKGNREFSEAVNEKKRYLDPIEGSYYSAAWWKRVLILLGGPFFNVLMAIILYTSLFSIGYSIETLPNKIILADDIDQAGTSTPASLANLQSADIITQLDGTSIDSFTDLQKIISQHPNSTISYEILRQGSILAGTITPENVNGVGRIGVYAWVEPIVTNITSGSPAEIAGLQNGDQIISANGVPIEHSISLVRQLELASSTFPVEVLRDGTQLSFTIALGMEEDPGFQTPTITDRYAAENAFSGFLESIRSVGSVVGGVFQSIGMIFTGAPLDQVISGPGQLVFSIGNLSLGSSNAFVFSRFLELIATISVAIAIMNLLPIPVTDGGQLLLPIAEAILARRLTLRFQRNYLTIGSILILLLLVLAVYQDFNFFRNL